MSEALKLVITRTFDAPQELVFDCWTQDKHLARWSGAPEGMTAVMETKQVRKGGSYKVHLDRENGERFTVAGKYLEVVRPEKLVFTHAWLDEAGDPGEEMLVTITFSTVGRKTRMTLTQVGFRSAASRDGHRSGWSSQMDRFKTYVNNL